MTKYDATDEMIHKQALHTIFEEIQYGKEGCNTDDNPDNVLERFLSCRRETGYVYAKI